MESVALAFTIVRNNTLITENASQTTGEIRDRVKKLRRQYMG